MPRSLKLYIAGVVAIGAFALVAATLLFPVEAGIAIRLTSAPVTADALRSRSASSFWIAADTGRLGVAGAAATRNASAVAVAPIMAPCSSAVQRSAGGSPRLARPRCASFAGGSLGTEHSQITRARHARGRWRESSARTPRTSWRGPGAELRQPRWSRACVFIVDEPAARLRLLVAPDRASRQFGVLIGDSRGIASSSHRSRATGLADGRLSTAVQWWATALFAVPLYSTRLAYQRFVEMREMFTQTIGALAEAVDKRDPFTSKHIRRVKEIAVDIGRVMRVERLGARGAGVGRSAPRRRQDRRAGPRPPEAGAADQGGADDHELAPGPGRADHRAGHEARGRSCRSSATTTSGTTARATRTGSSATRSPSSPASSTSPTPSRR